MISVTILTKNSEKYLKEVLQSLQQFPEVVIYDNGSTDCTLSIATQFSNVHIVEGFFEGFGPTHNKASNNARYDWILSIDSDEIVTTEMVKEIFNLSLQPNCVYSFPRHNYFNGKWIKGCGWYPDRQIRLYNRSITEFTHEQVHEKIISDQQNHISLNGAIQHYSYSSIGDFLSKMQAYSTLFANQYAGIKQSSLSKAILHGAFSFFKSYFIKRGFLDGYEGFLISAYNGHTAFYKYLKLLEANTNKIQKGG